MAMFNSYVKLPEGIALNSYGSYDHKQPEYSYLYINGILIPTKATGYRLRFHHYKPIYNR